MQKRICTALFTAALSTMAKMWKKLKRLLMDGWETLFSLAKLKIALYVLGMNRMRSSLILLG